MTTDKQKERLTIYRSKVDAYGASLGYPVCQGCGLHHNPGIDLTARVHAKLDGTLSLKA